VNLFIGGTRMVLAEAGGLTASADGAAEQIGFCCEKKIKIQLNIFY